MNPSTSYMKKTAARYVIINLLNTSDEAAKGKRHIMHFPGGAVVKNPPANAGDTGSIPGPGRSHMLWSS